MKRLMLVMTMMCSAGALAMPTRDELKKAQTLVAELMAPAMADFKAAGDKDKAATAVKVADASVEFANAAQTEAVKFLLLKGAVNFYTRGEAYDKAADAVADLQAKVKDVRPEVIAEITRNATSKISEAKAPRLFALYRMAKLQVRAASEAKDLEQKLKKVKSDALQRRYAEALAVSGDWKAAYAEFAKLSNAKLKSFVEAEAEGKAKNSESGEFWWSYEPVMEDADDVFKIHAVAFYRKALDAGEIAGLKKNIVEQRIKSYGDAAGGLGTGASPRTRTASGLYCVVDLSGGPDAKKYPVSYMSDVPKGGWSDEYKTTKLVLRRIEPGVFKMGPTDKSHVVKIKESFYMGVFEVSQKQWSLVMGDRPAHLKGAHWFVRPVEKVSYERIRGKDAGGKWPESDEVDVDSFMGLARKKTGLRFDLPTKAQWEYACRAGTETDFYNNTDQVGSSKDVSLDKIGRYQCNGGWNDAKWGTFDWGKVWTAPDRNCETNSATAAVGSYQPNNWGLYDMLGNVREWCLEGDGGLGGCWWDFAAMCKAYSSQGLPKQRGRQDYGFRICLPLAGGAATRK